MYLNAQKVKSFVGTVVLGFLIGCGLASCAGVFKGLTEFRYYEVSWPDHSEDEKIWACMRDPVDPKSGKIVCVSLNELLLEMSLPPKTDDGSTKL